MFLLCAIVCTFYYLFLGVILHGSPLNWLFYFFSLDCRSDDLSLIEQCYEFLFLVTAVQEDGAVTFYRSGGINVLASQMPALSDGNQFE